jgi:hypothetical protein
VHVNTNLTTVGGQRGAPSENYGRKGETVRRRRNDFFGFPSSTLAPGKTVGVLWRIREALSIPRLQKTGQTKKLSHEFRELREKKG